MYRAKLWAERWGDVGHSLPAAEVRGPFWGGRCGWEPPWQAAGRSSPRTRQAGLPCPLWPLPLLIPPHPLYTFLGHMGGSGCWGICPSPDALRLCPAVHLFCHPPRTPKARAAPSLGKGFEGLLKCCAPPPPPGCRLWPQPDKYSGQDKQELPGPSPHCCPGSGRERRSKPQD